MITQDMADGVYEIPESTYHADRSRLSNSAIGMFMNNRREFVREYVEHKPARQVEKAHFAFGGLFHGMLEGADIWKKFATEPANYDELFRDLCEECPEDMAGKKVHRGTNVYKKWKALQSGKELVAAEDAQLAAGMVMAIKTHDVASDILFAPDGLKERVLAWVDEETGEPMRARLDLHFSPKDGAVIADIKTIEGRREVSPMESPDLLAAHCFRYGYHRQMAVYIDGYRAVYGVTPVAYLIFVEKREEDPMVVVLKCEVDCPAVVDGRDGMKNGRPVGYRPAIRQIQHYREIGDWRHSHSVGVSTLQLPEWREKQIQFGDELVGFDEVA